MSGQPAALTLTAELDQQGAWSLADRLGERVGIDGVLADLSHRGRAARLRGVERARGFGWDGHDSRTHHWWPQGVTTSADNGAAPLVDTHRVLLAAWYRRDGDRNDRAARVSVVDLGTTAEPPERPSYEHVLLVEAGRDPVSKSVRHEHVRVHAGGLVWYDDRLLVADTRGGLRVFDLADVVRVAVGTPDTHGCRFVLPQSGRLLASAGEGTEPLRWSFCSVDRTGTDGPSLVAGEYSKPGTGARLARFPLPSGRLDGARLQAAEVLTTDIPSMQGACRVRGTYLVSASHGGHLRGHLWTGRGDGGWHRHAGALPIGPEDLSHDPHTNRLWTQTEYPGKRFVVSVPVPARH